MIALERVLEHLVIREGHREIRFGEGKLGLEIRLRLVGLFEHRCLPR